MKQVAVLVGLGMILLTTGAAAQTEPLTCMGAAGVLPLMRAGGLGELAGNININCFGGTPTAEGEPVPGVNIRVYLNTSITSRLLADAGREWTEALLLIDDPAPESQLVCGAPDAPETSLGVCAISSTGDGAGVYSGAPGRPNVFQGERTGDNVIDFFGVPLDPPGASGRTLRIVNIRANASQLVTNPWIPFPVVATVEVTAASPILVNNPEVFIGFTMPELNFTVEAPPVFQQTEAQNPQLLNKPNKKGHSKFSVRVQEFFPTVFLKRSIADYVDTNTSPAPLSQSYPGWAYFSETGFFNPSFPTIANRGNLGMAGLADSGTRIIVKFAGVPTGVSLFTDAVVRLTSGEDTSGVLRRIESERAAFVPATANEYGLVPVSVDPPTGELYAVYEVLEASPAMVEGAEIPVYVAYVTHGDGKAAAGTALVSVHLAPEGTAGHASFTEPLPRFSLHSERVTAFTIAP